MMAYYPTRIECDCCDAVFDKKDCNEGLAEFDRRARMAGWRDRLDNPRWLWKCGVCVAAGRVVGRVRA